jgi:hypothetical protein
MMRQCGKVPHQAASTPHKKKTPFFSGLPAASTPQCGCQPHCRIDPASTPHRPLINPSLFFLTTGQFFIFF